MLQKTVSAIHNGSSHRGCSFSEENNCAGVSFLVSKKDSNTGVFLGIFKNTYVEEHLRTSASVVSQVTKLLEQ